MSRNEYLRCTWREYLLRSNGYNRLRAKEFEHTRAIVYTTLSVNRGKSPLPKMEVLWPLITDNPDKEQNSLKAEKDSIMKQAYKLYGAKLNKYKA